MRCFEGAGTLEYPEVVRGSDAERATGIDRPGDGRGQTVAILQKRSILFGGIKVGEKPARCTARQKRLLCPTNLWQAAAALMLGLIPQKTTTSP
jgi:hypothetical protein